MWKRSNLCPGWCVLPKGRRWQLLWSIPVWWAQLGAAQPRWLWNQNSHGLVVDYHIVIYYSQKRASLYLQWHQCVWNAQRTSKPVWDSEVKMKSINTFSTAASAAARSWHQHIIIWKVHSWKGKKNWSGAGRCRWMKGTELGFRSRAATSRHSTDNCNTWISSCCCLAFSSAISIIHMGGNYPSKYWWVCGNGFWWVTGQESLRNQGLGAQGAVQAGLGVSSPCRVGEVIRESSLSLLSDGTVWKLGTASVFFLEKPENQRGFLLHWNFVGFSRINFSRCCNPGKGSCAGAGALHIQRRPGFHVQWPQAPHLAAGNERVPVHDPREHHQNDTC